MSTRTVKKGKISDQDKARRTKTAAYKRNKDQIDTKKRYYSPERYMGKIQQCDLKKYGERVRQVRKEHGASLKAFAEQIGISAATVSKIENGKVKAIDVELLYNICGIYNVTPDYLLGITKHQSESRYVDSDSEKEGQRFEALYCASQEAAELCCVLQLPPADNLIEIDKQCKKYPELCELMLKVLRSDDQKLIADATTVLQVVVQSAQCY